MSTYRQSQELPKYFLKCLDSETPTSLMDAVRRLRALSRSGAIEVYTFRMAQGLAYWGFPSQPEAPMCLLTWCQHNLHFDDYVRYDDEIFFKDYETLLLAKLSM